MRKPAKPVALVPVALGLAVFGNAWAPRAFELLAGSEGGAWLELIFPFLPMACLAAGAACFVRRPPEREA